MLFRSLFEVDQLVGGSDDWSEGGGHLQGHEEEDRAPNGEVPRIGHAEGAAGPEDEDRSEERRAGKECRSRWSPKHFKTMDTSS